MTAVDDSKQKEDPKCPCGSIPLGAMFRRDNGACSACGKQVPAPTVSGLPEIVEHPGYYDHGRFGHYYPGAMYQGMLATARKLHALVTSQQQEIETLNNQVGSLRWQIERIEEECTAAGWSLQWTDGGGSQCPFGWTRNPYLNIGTREDYIARIASLEAQLSSVSAQAPQACAGFEAHCDGSHYCVCGLPESAPCHQQPASEPERVVIETPGWSEPCTDGDACPDARRYGSVHPQPALAVPPWPQMKVMTLSGHGDFDGEWVRLSEARAIHATAVRLAEEHKKSEALRVELREKYDLVVAGNESYRNSCVRMECDKARVGAVIEALESELAALKAQEPVAWWWIEDGVMHEPSVAKAVFGMKPAHPCHPLYAAPVASISPSQQKAALKQVRAEERERVAAALEKLDKEQAAGFVRGLPEEQA